MSWRGRKNCKKILDLNLKKTTPYVCFIGEAYVDSSPTHHQAQMIIGQDESVFKQYLFSKKCWVGPGGVTQLLPKSDRYSRMISGFISQDFGVGLELSENELDEVNERRMSDQWGEYISVESVKNVYGTTKKKKRFKTNLHLSDSLKCE